MKCITKKKKVKTLTGEWVNFLSKYRYTWFTHLSFRDIPSTFTAQNRFKRFIRAIEKDTQRKVYYFVGMEYTRIGTPHFHALLGNLEDIRRSTWWKWWYTKYGRNVIEKYDPALRGCSYATKYVCKHLGWYDIQGLHNLDTYESDGSITKRKGQQFGIHMKDLKMEWYTE